MLQITANSFKWAANPRGDATNNLYLFFFHLLQFVPGIDSSFKTDIIWKVVFFFPPWGKWN